MASQKYTDGYYKRQHIANRNLSLKVRLKDRLRKFAPFWSGLTEKYLQLQVADIFRFFPKKGRVLEAGCGEGIFLRLAPKGYDVEGIDINKDWVAKLRKAGLKARYGDLQKKLPFQSGFFEGVYSCHVIEHLDSPEKMLSECYRVLKPGGVIVIRTPDWNAFHKNFFDDFTHKRPFSRVGLQSLLMDVGFDIVAVTPGYDIRDDAFFFLKFAPKAKLSLEKLYVKARPSEMLVVARKPE